MSERWDPDQNRKSPITCTPSRRADSAICWGWEPDAYDRSTSIPTSRARTGDLFGAVAAARRAPVRPHEDAKFLSRLFWNSSTLTRGLLEAFQAARRSFTPPTPVGAPVMLRTRPGGRQPILRWSPPTLAAAMETGSDVGSVFSGFPFKALIA